MKKVLSLLMVCSLLLACITGCGGSSTVPAGQQSATQSAASESEGEDEVAEAADTEAPADAIKVGFLYPLSMDKKRMTYLSFNPTPGISGGDR